MVAVRYFYAWMPFVIIVGTVVLFTIPYLALVALLLVALAAVAAVAWAVVSASRAVGRRIRRRWQGRSGASRRTEPSLPYPLPRGATVLLANPPADRDRT